MSNEDYYKKYYLEDEEILDIAKTGIVVFDSSALLALYYYSDNTRNEIYKKLMDIFSGRLWIPGQVYFEFLKNKDKVIHKPEETYRALLSANKKGEANIQRIEEFIDQIKDTCLTGISGQLNTLIDKTKNKDRHPYFDESIYQEFREELDNIETQIVKLNDKAKSLHSMIEKEVNNKIKELQDREDAVYLLIHACFTIGPEYSFSDMLGIAQEGQRRYSDDIPPGYKDVEKKGIQKYGDLYVWKQILSYAKSKKKSVLLVSNDIKEDWWDKDLAGSGAPRIELLREFKSYTGKSFWSYDMRSFVSLINIIADDHISDSIIEEIDEVSMEEEHKEYYEDNETYVLFRDILEMWLKRETEYELKELIPHNPDWRIFSRGFVFNATDFQGNDCRVILSIINHTNYSSVLHNIQAGYEIKKYYERFGKKYRYRQIIVGKDEKIVADFRKVVKDHTKLERLLMNTTIENTLVYLKEGDFVYVDSNHPVG